MRLISLCVVEGHAGMYLSDNTDRTDDVGALSLGDWQTWTVSQTTWSTLPLPNSKPAAPSGCFLLSLHAVWNSTRVSAIRSDKHQKTLADHALGI